MKVVRVELRLKPKGVNRFTRGVDISIKIDGRVLHPDAGVFLDPSMEFERAYVNQGDSNIPSILFDIDALKDAIRRYHAYASIHEEAELEHAPWLIEFEQPTGSPLWRPIGALPAWWEGNPIAQK